MDRNIETNFENEIEEIRNELKLYPLLNLLNESKEHSLSRLSWVTIQILILTYVLPKSTSFMENAFFLTQNCHNFLFIETNPPYGEITWSMLTKGIYFLNIPLFGLNFMYVPKIKKANFKWKMAFSFKRKVLEGSTKNRIRLLKFWLTPFVGSEHQNLGVSQALER